MQTQPLIRENVSLAPMTYYKIGGHARYFAKPQNIDELSWVANFIKEKKLRYFILGAGSNVLFDDDGFDGLILSTTALDRSLSSHSNEIEAGASVMVIQLLRLCMSEGIGGFEFLVGVPGNIGGVIFMNAGTKSGEICGALTEVTAYDLATGVTRTLSRTAMNYSYRSQKYLKPHEIVLRGKLKGELSEPKKVQNDVQSLLEARKKSQPIDKPSCGSVFKNPNQAEGIHAWKVISDIGLRGHRIGNAQISELHTNFIVNLGGARASDVRALIDEAKKRAQERLGIVLQEEVKIIAREGGTNIEVDPPASSD